MERSFCIAFLFQQKSAGLLYVHDSVVDFIRLMEKFRDTTWDAPKGLDIGIKPTFGAS